MTSPIPNEDLQIQSQPNEISMLEVITAVLRNWRAVVLLPLLLALIAGMLALRGTRSYVATASFMPQTADTRGVSGAAALAQQFGVNLGTDRPGHSPAFYVDLLESATILRRAAESNYQFPSASDGRKSGTLVQLWKLDAQETSTPPWRSAVGRLRGAVTAAVVRETGVVEVRVSSHHPLLAEQITTRLLELLNEYNLEMRQDRAREEARFIGGRLKDVQAELMAAEDALKTFLNQNRTFRNSPQLSFEHDRLQRQVVMRQEVYGSLLRAQEQARIDGVRDTPLLTIIDSPHGSALPSPRRIVLRTVTGFLLGLLLAVGFAATREAARRGKQDKDPRYREFEDSMRRVWEDLRHPGKWFRNGEEPVVPGKD